MGLQPGIYRATVRGVPDQIVMLTEGTVLVERWISLSQVSGEVGVGGNWRSHGDEHITDAHRMILLDPTKINIPWICGVLRGEATHGAHHGVSYVADQIEAQSEPPRIKEPTVAGARVRDVAFDGREVEFMRIATIEPNDYHWVSLNTGQIYVWEALVDPVLA